MTSHRFTVLTVCTGNICRSPLAQQLLSAELRDYNVDVSSAGTCAVVGNAMDDTSARLSRELGGREQEAHVARQLAADQVRAADLVLAMSRDHRRSVAELVPAAAAKTFTIRELARILTTLTPEDIATLDGGPPPTLARALVAKAASLRGLLPRADAEAFDVVDPYAGDESVFRLSTKQIVPAVATIAEYLALCLRQQAGARTS